MRNKKGIRGQLRKRSLMLVQGWGACDGVRESERERVGQHQTGAGAIKTKSGSTNDRRTKKAAESEDEDEDKRGPGKPGREEEEYTKKELRNNKKDGVPKDG